MSVARPVSGSRSRAAAFTLLEAVIALTILASVMIVCLGLRGQALVQRGRLEARHAVIRESNAIFEMLTAGLLERPARDPENGEQTWVGQHLGKPYTIVRRRDTAPNPVQSAFPDSPEKLSGRIAAWRYQIEYRGRVSEFVWHR